MENLKIKKTGDWVNYNLRRIEPDFVETDTILGGFYQFISKEESPDRFNEVTKLWNEDDLKDVYAVITFFDQSIMPLYEGSKYFVMTDTGGTVANRSKK